MENKLGFYSVLASLGTSLFVVVLFYILAMAKVRANAMYTTVDVYGGMVFVFILAMIVAASVWPGVIERRMKR